MNNLKILRKRKDVSQQEVADYLGVSRGAYGFYETGTRAMNPDVLAKLSDYFGVYIDAILGRENVTEPFGKPIEVKPEIVAEDEVMIPVVASLRCGFGYQGEPYTILKKIPVPKSYVSRWGKDIVAVEAVGKSMIPTIQPGSYLIVVPGSAWEDRWIVVADVNDSDTIKRIFRSGDDGIDLIPDNEKYRLMHFSPEDIKDYQITVLGHVVKAISPDL
jgi:SOS-response transcriptional repressor LexA